ncbi:Zinc finger protein 143 [Phytophthora citrophthora]|uniref:Zinc finger protein 143 n=1 Tax=Phytophthora citrophthora TaxID=4793 RepID=A0AAD9G8T5_9STRA|nr:Zinc finger protein 143 [Phytophthora citrophthora]
MDHIKTAPTPVPTAAPAAAPATSQERERPFQCPVPSCSGRFQRKFTLREHMKTHTGEKPYQCAIRSCAKRFSTSGNLARHRRLHLLKKLECPVEGCTRIFTKSEKLARHLQNHLGSVAHICVVEGCGKTFSTAGNLTRHLRTQHPPGAVAAARAAAPPQLRAPIARPSPLSVAEYAPWSMHTATTTTTAAEQNISVPQAANVSDHEILDVLQCLFVDENPAVSAPMDQSQDQYRLQSDQPVLLYL